MKRFIVAALGLLSTAQLMSSCKKDYLDENPPSLYTPQTVLVDSLGFEAQMAGLQNVVRDVYTNSENQGMLSIMQLGTDVAVPGQTQGIEVPYYNYAQLTSQDGGASYFWGQAYRIINNSNIIISSATSAPTTLTLRQGYKNRIAAEARFFRAYAYDLLATLYGDVPLIDQPLLTAPRTDFTRAPIATVNDFIVNDLTTAVPNLLPASRLAAAQSGRITRGAAQHLLGQVYLRMNQGAKAEQILQALINSNDYKLVSARYGVNASAPGDYFADMFIVGNQRRSQGNTEIIWGIEQQLNVPSATTNGQQRRVWVPAYYNIKGMIIADSLGGRGLGRLRLSNWVDYQLYTTSGSTDIRNSKYNLKRRFYYNDPAQTSLYGKRVTGLTGVDTVYNITPYTTKWNQYNPADAFGYGTIKDLPMMRLGESYLLLAEAQLQQGNTAGAAASINVLRTRARATAVTSSQVDLNFILDERARELIGEEQRRLTLMRTGTLVDRATRLNGASVTGLTTRNNLLPIPQSEIDRNTSAVLKQNTGY